MNFLPKNRCAKCNRDISSNVANFSLNKYGILLCFNDQEKIKKNFDRSTPTARLLYFKLLEANIPAELEQYDGHKTIDIVVLDAKLNIEVDGKHHHFNAVQALADLYRYVHSSKKGFETIRLPNILVDSEPDKVVEILVGLIRQRLGKQNVKTHQHSFYSENTLQDDIWDDEEECDDDDFYY